jgi:hypothetical protein
VGAVNAEKLFRMEQYCDGQDIYETPEPYNMPTPAEDYAAELAAESRDYMKKNTDGDMLCPERCKVIIAAPSVNAMMRALKAHNLECAVCGEWRKRMELARAMLGAGAFDAEVA